MKIMIQELNVDGESRHSILLGIDGGIGQL